MGIFSYLRDALSGKIYKKNILIGDNTVKLFEKASQLSDESFIKRWVIACIISIHGNLEEILFGKKGKSIATIKKNLNISNIDKVYEIIKILVCYYISATKKSDSPSKYLKNILLEQKDFEDEIFSFFSFNSGDIEIFRELDNKYKNEHKLYASEIYRRIVERAFGIKGTKDILDTCKKLGNKFSLNLMEIIYLRVILTSSWTTVFIDLGVFESTGYKHVFYKKIEKDINKYYKKIVKKVPKIKK